MYKKILRTLFVVCGFSIITSTQTLDWNWINPVAAAVEDTALIVRRTVPVRTPDAVIVRSMKPRWSNPDDKCDWWTLICGPVLKDPYLKNTDRSQWCIPTCDDCVETRCEYLCKANGYPNDDPAHHMYCTCCTGWCGTGLALSGVPLWSLAAAQVFPALPYAAVGGSLTAAGAGCLLNWLCCCCSTYKRPNVEMFAEPDGTIG